MGTLKIVWKKRAILRFEQIEQWYVQEMGNGAAAKFAKGIYDTVQTLSHSPQIGILDKNDSTPRLKYYCFLSHPRYRIVYRFTSKTLYIAAIRSTLMMRQN